jgi:putative transposon-encoded protein
MVNGAEQEIGYYEERKVVTGFGNMDKMEVPDRIGGTAS